MLIAKLAEQGRRLGIQRSFWREKRIAWRLFLDGRIEPYDRLVFCPEFGASRTSGTAPNLGVDNAEYVLGVSEDGKTSRAAARKSAFLDLLRKCAQDTGADQFSAAAEMLTNIEVPAEIGAKDQVGLAIDDSLWLHELPGVIEFWNATCMPEYLGDERQCMCCGENRQCVRILPFKIMKYGLCGALVSSNNNCTNSHGHEQTAGSPICFDCAQAYAHAANAMLSAEEHRWKLGETTMLFWVTNGELGSLAKSVRTAEPEDINAAFSEGMGEEMSPIAADLHSVLRSAIRGRQAAAAADVSMFCFAGLRQQGNGRISTVMEGEAPLAEVQGSIAEWFLIHEEICGETLALWKIDRTICEAMKVDELPRRFQQHLLDIVFFRKQPADWLMKTMVSVMRRQKRKGQKINSQVLMLFELWRRRNNMPECKEALACGRLFAVMEKAQFEYHNRKVPNRSIADRYIMNFARQPAETLAKTWPMFQKWTSRMKKDSRAGKAYWIENDMQKILMELPGGLPSVLTLEEQAEFWRGYQDQRSIKATATEKDVGNENESDNQ